MSEALFQDLCEIIDRSEQPGLTRQEQYEILRDGAIRIAPGHELFDWYMTRLADILEIDISGEML